MIIIFVIVVLCGFSSANTYSSGFENDFKHVKSPKSKRHNKDNENNLFEKENFFDDNGIEHIVDENLYCVEHDDFYEDF